MVNKKISCTFMPSLKHSALITVTIALWNRGDIRDLMARLYATEHSNLKKPKTWHIIDDKVKEKVSNLPLPEMVKKEILDLIHPVGLELKKWKELFGKYDKDLIPELCWTPQGTMEQKKTAKVFIKNETLDVSTRYRIACVYCLEDEIRELWGSVPHRNEEDIFNEENPFFILLDRLIVFWIYDIKGELNEFTDWVRTIDGREITPYQFAFEYSVEHQYKVASEYFLQKLSLRERDESLVKCAKKLASEHFDICTHDGDPRVNYADVLCFLLSQMNEEQQANVIESCPAGVLSCLLCWPWHSFFMETANRVWDFLAENDYLVLFRVIITKIVNGYKDCNYHKLLEEFWEQSPSTCKKLFIGFGESSMLLLRVLFELVDKESIRLMLKDATVEEKNEILITSKEYFIRRALIPERTLEREKDLWQQFFQFLNDLIHDNNEKRGVEDETSSPAKRLKFN